jgi:4-methyl-5(b-hydroxyethyl)-thiazole monophosphate biosynthesis
MKVLVPLAEGFEEIEAITIIDILRRAGIDTVTAALRSSPVTGAHGIAVTADRTLDENENFEAIVLPGGMPGSSNLKNDQRIINIIKKINKSGGLTAAICAAPIVLSKAGILTGKRFTCYPGYEDEISEGDHVNEKVVIDGSIITGMGAGCAPLFALAIVEFLSDKETAKNIKKQIIGFW